MSRFLRRRPWQVGLILLIVVTGVLLQVQRRRAMRPPPGPLQRGSGGRHAPIEADYDANGQSIVRPDCYTDVGVGPASLRVDLNRVFPEFKLVESEAPVVLEGRVVGGEEESEEPEEGDAHVSHEEWPFTHYSHDFTFSVRPDRGYERLPAERSPRTQRCIEVEWETGLGADNAGNPLALLNRRGDSGGFFSAGHRRGEPLDWWPTLGDWVHVEGFWIWDRGHGGENVPPTYVTELHPPRLVVTCRQLPEGISPAATAPGGGRRFFLASRADLFASGDGGALWNNRAAVPPFVTRVRMSERDYTFRVPHRLPKPGPGARLRWQIRRNPGDTFPGDPEVTAYPQGSRACREPHLRVTLPWKSRHVSDRALFSRRLNIYWSDPPGVPQNYPLRLFRVTLDRLFVRDNRDGSFQGKGEYRLFTEVAGHWLFLNERPVPGNEADVLGQGLGTIGNEARWPPGGSIHRSFLVYLPAHSFFRVHTSGWEADEADRWFGRLLAPTRCDSRAVGELISLRTGLRGGNDDAIGEVNTIFHWTAAGALQSSPPAALRGEPPQPAPGWRSDWAAPGKFHRLDYRIEELPRRF